MKYATKYTDAISPSPKDVGPDVELSESDLASSRSLASALRQAGVLMSGARVASYRVERGGKVVLFPRLPGSTTYWWSVTLTPRRTRGERVAHRSAAARGAQKTARRKRASSQWWIFSDGKKFYTAAGATRHAKRTGQPVPRPSQRGFYHGREWRTVTGVPERAPLGVARRRARARRARSS